MWTLFKLVIVTFRLLPSARRDLVLENLALRHQLAVCARPRRPHLREADRRFWSSLAKSWTGWREALALVQPETVVRWHRTAWRRYWTWKGQRRGRGRPRVSLEVKALIRRIASENPRWGAIRIVGELRALGLDVSASSVRAYRRQALRRPPSPSWRAFLRLHAHEIWATDFFTVPTLTFQTLYVFVAIAHDRRRIVHVNVTAHPTATWVWRQIIQATPWSTAPRFLLHDHDRSYGREFALRAAKIGIKAIQTPVRAPKANAIAERVIGTLRRECTDHIIVFNEQHLRRVLREYVAYYNDLRPHRSLALEAPAGPRALSPPSLRGEVASDPVLGGVVFQNPIGAVCGWGFETPVGHEYYICG